MKDNEKLRGPRDRLGGLFFLFVLLFCGSLIFLANYSKDLSIRLCSNLEAIDTDGNHVIFPGLDEPIRVMTEAIQGVTDPTPLTIFRYDLDKSRGAKPIRRWDDFEQITCIIPSEACHQLPPMFEWCIQANMEVPITYSEWKTWIDGKKRIS